MANNFPPVPTDFELQSVQYTFQPPSGDLVLPPIEGTTLILEDGIGATSGTSSVIVNFTTPGQAGSFDQDTFEALVIQVVTDICQLFATLTGATLAEVQAEFSSIARRWTWVDTAGNTAVYTDSLAYTPAS